MARAERRPSLRRRLLALLMAGTGAVWLVTAAFTYQQAHAHARRLFDAQLAGYSGVLGALAGHELNELAGSGTTLGEPQWDAITYQIFSISGELRMRSREAPETPLARWNGFADVASGGRMYRVHRRTDAREALVFVVAEPMAARDALARDIAIRFAWPLVLGLPLLAFAVWAAVARSLQPLTALAREVRGRDPVRLQPMVVAHAPSEVAPLVDALNNLFVRMDRSFARERALTVDAAQELRAPLAAIRNQAEVALGSHDDLRRRHALQQVVAAAARAISLVEQLMLLERLDNTSDVGTSPVDVARLAQDVVTELHGEASARSIALMLEVAPREAITVAGDVVMLHAMLRNVVENGVRYSPDGGRVRVAVQGDASGVSITVDDNGPGVPAALHERIFDRFFRAVSGHPAGNGLGLSIARRVAELHGGSIGAARSAALGGLCVSIALPLDKTGTHPISRLA